MGGKKKTINRLINSAKYAVSEFTSQDQIEIHSNNLAFISGCLNLSEYNENKITLEMHKMTLVIVGERLEPESLINGQMALRGIIKGVSFVDNKEAD